MMADFKPPEQQHIEQMKKQFEMEKLIKEEDVKEAFEQVKRGASISDATGMIRERAEVRSELRSKEEIEERIREFQSKLEDMEYYGIKDLHYEHELHLRIKELQWVLKQND